MLETILQKLNVNSIEEYFEKQKKFYEKTKGQEIDYQSPLLVLTFEELDFVDEYVNTRMNKSASA